MGAVLQKDYERPKGVALEDEFRRRNIAFYWVENGGVVFAEKYISSSLAALLVATEPFWIVLLSWLWLKKARPNWKVALGLAIGFFGVWLLIGGQTGKTRRKNSGSMQLFGTFAVIGAAMCWATGSIYGLRSPVPKSAIQTSGMQMFSGGFGAAVSSV